VQFKPKATPEGAQFLAKDDPQIGVGQASHAFGVWRYSLKLAKQHHFSQKSYGKVPFLDRWDSAV